MKAAAAVCALLLLSGCSGRPEASHGARRIIREGPFA